MLRNIAFYAFSLVIIIGLFLGFNSRKQDPTNRTKHKSSASKTKKSQHLTLLHQQLAKPKDLRHKLKLTAKIYQADKVSPGLMLLAASGSEEVYLIDHSLNILHSWPLDAERARLRRAEDGSCKLGVVFGSKWGESRPPWEDLKSLIAEFDWNANPVWSYLAKDILHHDFQYLEDDSLLLLRRDIIGQELRAKKYQDPSRWSAIRSDLVEHVNRSGEILWEWPAWKHLDLNSCGRRPDCVFLTPIKAGKKRKKIRQQDWLHTNAISFLPENHWYQKGHEEFKPGNLLIMARNLWESYIADRETGKILWRYGGEDGDGIINGHEVRMIKAGLPGAGNILIFDNGGEQRGYSIIKEINPITKEIVWSFNNSTDNPNAFYSPTAGSAQRLANGNTFISGDNGGDILEVTAKGEIVFRFDSSLRISRAKKYPLDYCSEFTQLRPQIRS